MSKRIQRKSKSQPKLIYIAHTLTQGDSNSKDNRNNNLEDYYKCATEVLKQGHILISWSHHAEIEKRELLNRPYNFWIGLCKQLILKADELWVYTDPTLSEGVRIEIDFAMDNGITVVAKWN